MSYKWLSHSPHLLLSLFHSSSVLSFPLLSFTLLCILCPSSFCFCFVLFLRCVLLCFEALSKLSCREKKRRGFSFALSPYLGCALRSLLRRVSGLHYLVSIVLSILLSIFSDFWFGWDRCDLWLKPGSFVSRFHGCVRVTLKLCVLSLVAVRLGNLIGVRFFFFFLG